MSLISGITKVNNNLHHNDLPSRQSNRHFFPKKLEEVGGVWKMDTSLFNLLSPNREFRSCGLPRKPNSFLGLKDT